MDTDSSSKFIGSLTKFLQSLCNGYVEFQRGVELVGHIYLNIDTGEKVDYILHERLSKNDENSVTFVSNSFHAQPLDQKKTPDNRDSVSKSGGSNRDNRDSSDDDIMIVDQSGKGIPGSSNSGSIPSRGMKRVGSPSVSERQAQRVRGTGGPSLTPNRGSSSFQQNNRQHSGPSATVTSQNVTQQESLNIGDVKLEQISKDELLSLASQVGEGGSRQPHTAASTAAHSRSPRTGDGAMWIKQEAADDDGGGSETGWSHTRDDSNSNSGSNLYPVMLHQNPAAYSSPVFPGFSGPGAPGSHSADPMPGTSQDPGGLDPSAWFATHPSLNYLSTAFPAHTMNMAKDDRRRCPSASSSGFPKSSTLSMRRYRQKLKENPELRREYRARQVVNQQRYMARKKQRIVSLASALAEYSSHPRHMMERSRQPEYMPSRSPTDHGRVGSQFEHGTSRSQSEHTSGTDPQHLGTSLADPAEDRSSRP